MLVAQAFLTLWVIRVFVLCLHTTSLSAKTLGDENIVLASETTFGSEGGMTRRSRCNRGTRGAHSFVASSIIKGKFSCLSISLWHVWCEL